MQRIPVHSSIRARIPAKLSALLCLTVLALSWLPHRHEVSHPRVGASQSEFTRTHAYARPQPSPSHADAHADTVQRERLSSDDDHHEHSSRIAALVEICLACRSHTTLELGGRAPAQEFNASPSAPRVPTLRTRPPAYALFAGLALLRAPPATLL